MEELLALLERIPKPVFGAVAGVVFAAQLPWWFTRYAIQQYRCDAPPTATPTTVKLFPKESEPVFQAVCRNSAAPDWFLKAPGPNQHWQALQVDASTGAAIQCTCNVVPK